MLGRVVSEITAMHGPPVSGAGSGDGAGGFCAWRARGTMAIENVDATAGVFEDSSDDEIIDGPGA